MLMCMVRPWGVFRIYLQRNFFAALVKLFSFNFVKAIYCVNKRVN